MLHFLGSTHFSSAINSVKGSLSGFPTSRPYSTLNSPSNTSNSSRSPLLLLPATCVLFTLVSCSNSNEVANTPVSNTPKATSVIPATRFDLSHWKLTLPTVSNNDGKVDNVSVAELQGFTDERFFYIDEEGDLVFTSPNKGGTTVTSLNTRSELRYMSNGPNPVIKASDPLSNFALASHPNASEFASVGGKMEVTMHVDHAPLHSNMPEKSSSYAAVIGQIHGAKDKSLYPKGFGYGNEPLKIFYKKWPHHKTGSIYWNYERNLEKDNPDRKDISYVVWGKARNDSSDPGKKGIALGEDFSYTVNVYEDTMYLTFESPRLGTVRHQINLANNVDGNGKVDQYDNPLGYSGDANYFKAGVYNQCRASKKTGETQTPCPGTGDWETDKANGDYAQVSFSRLVVSEAQPQ